MKYSFLLFVFFFSCQTLNVDKYLDEKFEKIERANYFLYFYSNSQIYIKKDKLTNNFSVFLNVILNSQLNLKGSFLRLIKDDKYIGNIDISKVISIGNFKFLYVNIDRSNVGLILRALNPDKHLCFFIDDDSYQVWTKLTFKYDARFVDVDFKSTKETLEYALKNNIL